MPERGGVMIDMTDPVRKEKFKRVSGKVVDLLRAECTPIEAYAILIFIRESFEESYGFQGGKVFTKEEEGHA